MERTKRFIRYFSRAELILWASSVLAIICAFCAFDRTQYLTLAASLIGVTSLIFTAKGNPFGQLLMIVYSLLYGLISFRFSYYGEMITYLGMTAPMVLFSLIAWLKHPLPGKHRRGAGEPYQKERDTLHVDCSSCRHGRLFLSPAPVPYSAYPSEHTVRHDQLPRRLSDVQKKPRLRDLLCGERYHSDYPVAAGLL